MYEDETKIQIIKKKYTLPFLLNVPGLGPSAKMRAPKLKEYYYYFYYELRIQNLKISFHHKHMFIENDYEVETCVPSFSSKNFQNKWLIVIKVI